MRNGVKVAAVSARVRRDVPPARAVSDRRAWDRVIPFFTFSRAARRDIYTTSAFGSIHSRLREIIKTRGDFPSGPQADLADPAPHYPRWEPPPIGRKEAMNPFAIAYGECFTRPAA